MTEQPDDIIYMVDLDGTGSMHPASKGDPGAIVYVRWGADSSEMTVEMAAAFLYGAFMGDDATVNKAVRRTNPRNFGLTLKEIAGNWLPT